MRWVVALILVALSLAACELARAIMRLPYLPPTRAVYRAPFAIGIGLTLLLGLAELPIHNWVETIADPFWNAVATGFLVSAAPEQLGHLAGLLTWVTAFKVRDGRIIATGAVGVALGFTAIESVLGLTLGNYDWTALLILFVQRALFSTPSSFATGLAVGVWVAVALADRNQTRGKLTIFAVLLIAILVHGCWDASVFLVGKRCVSGGILFCWAAMSPGLLTSLAIDAAAILIGRRALSRAGADA